MGITRHTVFAAVVCALVLVVFVNVGEAVDRSKFRTCEQTGFCRRLRTTSASNKEKQYAQQGWYVDASSVTFDAATSSLRAELRNPRHPKQPALVLSAALFNNGVARVQILENPAIEKEFGTRWQAASEVLVADSPSLVPVSEPNFSKHTSKNIEGGADLETGATICDSSKVVCLHVAYRPLLIQLTRSGNVVVTFNRGGLLHFEQRHAPNPLPAAPAAPAEGDAAAAAADAAAAPAAAAPTPLSDEELVFPYDVDGMRGESFGGHTDTNPKGPSALSVDVAFEGASHVYGLPEHATSLSLKRTAGEGAAYSDPYRLFNLDVFEHDLDTPMALYGSVPVLYSHSVRHNPADGSKTPQSAGAFFLNAAEMFVDVMDLPDTHVAPSATVDTASIVAKAPTKSTAAHFMVETGVIDLFLFSGPTPANSIAQYMSLTGLPIMPPKFSVGYHQCRWNYKSEEDVAQVNEGFDKHDIPYDTLWLDIEHTDAKKYFTWDKALFPTPEEMQKKLAALGRHMVTIVDPHIKRDNGYSVHTDALAKNLYITNKDNGVFEGWCWPGSSSYLDFLRPDVCAYWKDRFSLASYQGSTPFLHTWNDMNEPSVFNGPEVTMPKDCKHLSNSVEHRDVHNIYGMKYHYATYEGLLARQAQIPAGTAYFTAADGTVIADGAVPPSPLDASSSVVLPPGPARVAHRPFVLSRAFFAGTQRSAAVWTGDNKGDWDFLNVATPMLLNLAITGIQFSGSDAGGFFGDPSAELMQRWWQAAAFTPFFRGHAHIDTKRREPWLLGEPHTSIMRAAIRQRYVNMPYIYTHFFLANATGIPPMRPLFLEFPADEQALPVDDEFMFGNALLIKPVTKPGQLTSQVFLPGVDTSLAHTTVWYDLHTGLRYGDDGEAKVAVPSPAEHSPVLIRGRTGIVQQTRARRSTSSMTADPYSIILALNPFMESEAELYIDDGVSFNYREKGAYVYRTFSAAPPAPSSGSQALLVIRGARGNVPTMPLPSFTSVEASVAADGSVQLERAEIPTSFVPPPVSNNATAENIIERLTVLGLPSRVSSVKLVRADGTAEDLEFTQELEPERLTIRGPMTRVDSDFTIEIM